MSIGFVSVSYLTGVVRTNDLVDGILMKVVLLLESGQVVRREALAQSLEEGLSGLFRGNSSVGNCWQNETVV